MNNEKMHLYKKQYQQPIEEEIPGYKRTSKTADTSRWTFYITDMSREQMEAAGYGLHHQSEDGKYLIMWNGTRAFAIAAELPEVNPLKIVEDIVEQNDNNTLQTTTVAELEQKAKGGEPISLIDYANAIKTEKNRVKKRPKRNRLSGHSSKPKKNGQCRKRQQKQKITIWSYEHDEINC